MGDGGDDRVHSQGRGLLAVEECHLGTGTGPVDGATDFAGPPGQVPWFKEVFEQAHATWQDGLGEDGIRLPYANHRPDYTEEQIIEVWNNSKQPADGVAYNEVDGSEFHYKAGDVIVKDVNGQWRKIEWEPGSPGPRPWAMGHIKGQEYDTLRNKYLNKELTTEQFLAIYRDPGQYEVQDISRNAAHMDEQIPR